MLYFTFAVGFILLFLLSSNYLWVINAKIIEKIVKNNPTKFQPASRIFKETDYLADSDDFNCIADALDINPVRWNVNYTWPSLEDAAYRDKSSDRKRRKDLLKALKFNDFQKATLKNIFNTPQSRKLTFAVYSYNKERNSSFIHVFWLDGHGCWISKPGENMAINLAKANIVSKSIQVNGIKTKFLGLYWVDTQKNKLKQKTYKEAVKANALIGLPAPPF